MTEKRMVLDSYSETEIEEAFRTAFATAASYNYITSYEVEAERDYDDGQKMKISVEVGSMAGTPTKAEFNKVDNMQEFELTFVTGKKTVVEVVDIVDYNAMEYHVIYAEKDMSAAVVETVPAEEEEEDTNTLAGSE